MNSNLETILFLFLRFTEASLRRGVHALSICLLNDRGPSQGTNVVQYYSRVFQRGTEA